MDVVHLPLLTAFTSLKDAVRAMRVHQTSAVLRESPTDLVLVEIPKIFSALGQHLTELSNVNVTTPVHRLTPADISAWNVDPKNPRNTMSEYENLLDAVGRSYVLVDSFLNTGMIVTRHEDLADEVRKTPKDCYCNGIHEHSFPPPSVASGNPCPDCPGTVHCE